MSTVNTVSVHILDKEYQVACPEDQQAELIISARYLDKQMRAIRDTGKVIGLERIAVMAALNISHELLKASGQGAAPAVSEDVDNTAVASLQRKVDEALYQLRQLEIS
ncbi:MAG: cell division protein ZapA [Halieaceae bacterium]|nr:MULTISPECIES: cell division protein ZapA [Haliea]MCR9185537.1 cell division protein ZapA [Halieaceae bacterium]MAY92491.1 cell division protein ZapA [Haliea sp.]MBK40881.1 cell division protein ZapA [Haliea sp.]MBP68544.1 cell division protein ZapA [Haliea sp.]HAN67555.1 cell division protein ZapA [Halieaceae bacterium]